MIAKHSIRRGFGWSATYMLVTRASTLAAVPLALHGLGTSLYGIWVLAGSLVMIQSLFDLGAASAMVRYVAVASAAGSRGAVVSIIWRTLLFYVALSLLVAVPMWLLAGQLVGQVSFLGRTSSGAAVTIIRWAAVAFALTNIVLVLSSALQGINQVATSYRDQTIGWMVYLPVLAFGFDLWSPALAVGLAWGVGFGLQLLLLSRSLFMQLRLLPNAPAPVPGYHELLFFGGRWQVSAWADFATFQLPRFLAGLGLSAEDLLAIDVSIRAAQTAVAPLLAFYPVVLPRAAQLLRGEGMAGLRSFLARYYWYGSVAIVAGVSLLIPLEVPALALWTGRTVGSFDQVLASLILLGTAAHASTGLLTSAQLARGDVRSVMRYKAVQLGACVVLLAGAIQIALWTVGLAVALALIVPACLYNQRAARQFGLGSVFADRGATVQLLGLGLVIAVPGTLVVRLLARQIPAWVLFALAAILAVTGLLISARALCSMLRRNAPPYATAASVASLAPDHLARN